MPEIHRVAFDGEPDLVRVRRLVRRLAQLLQFEQRDEVKITAAVSELTRAAAAPTGGAVEVSFSVNDDPAAPQLVIEVAGPGLAPARRKRSSSAAEGVVAAEKLLERAADATAPTTLRFGKPLPAHAPPVTRSKLAAVRAELERIDAPRSDVSREELLRQSHELAKALLDIEERKQELTTLNAELSDTNRGVVALYAELDERANHLRRADELKTRFFSHMSHEFRTPLNSILALSSMLLEETDGPLNSEQRRQVGMIRDGVADLLDLVGDLLDLAKMEAGKTQVNVAEFAIGTIFGALRGMIRPLLGSSVVSLEFCNAAELPPLLGDEAKVIQILRNFLSNAVKFTERGTITVGARLLSAGESVAGIAVEIDSVLFAVADTGIGIATEHQAAIFEEFRQVENRLQRKARGSGLGLPLCRRLAGLLGGRVWVESEVGHGATFYLLIPRVLETPIAQYSPDLRPRLLIVDELPERRAALGEAFRDSAFLPIEASTSEVTASSLVALRPTAAIVDVASATPAALEALRAAAVPLVSVPRADEVRREQLVADTYRAALRAKLSSVLIVDDDAAYRTILGKQLAPFCERVRTTEGADEAAAAIRAGDVDCVVLDLIMPEVDGLTLLRRIRDDETTAHLPVVVCSSKALTADEQALLRRLRAPFLPKDGLGAAQVARALLDARRAVGAFGRALAENAA
jgi:signal transduction histidine kinase/ActR/RegA family two-component response regulator